MAVYLTVFLAILNQIGLKGSKILVALYAIDLGASPFTIGMLVSMYAIFPLMLAVYAGRISDRLGVCRPIMLGSFGMCGSLLIPNLLPFLPGLFLSAALVGVSHIFFHVATQHLVGSFGDGEARTRNVGTFSLGGAVSGMIGPLLTGFMVDRAGYAMTYHALAAIVVIPGIILLFYARFIPSKIINQEPAATGGVRELLGNRSLRNTLVTSGVILTGIDLFTFYMPIHGRSIGLSASVIGVVIGAQAAAAFVVRLWMPWMTKKYGEMQVLTWSLLVAAITYFLFPAFENPLILTAISFLLGLGLGCGQPLSIILTYTHSPSGRAGEALGLRLTVNKFTQMVVPLLFGSLGSAFGIYPIFWASGLLLAFGGVSNSKQHQPQKTLK
jgi:MFS family permease